MLAGGDSIRDVNLLRTGATDELFDGVRAPPTIGTWLRAFTWSNVRRLDAVSRQLPAGTATIPKKVRPANLQVRDLKSVGECAIRDSNPEPAD